MIHKVNEVELKNGTKGLVIDVPGAPVFGIDIGFRAGSFLSPKDKWETAHLMEHLMLGANKKFASAREFSAEFQKNGAYKNASTGPYDMSYIVESASFEWERVLDLLLLSVESLRFSDEQFAAEMGNVKEELVGDLNKHYRQLVTQSREHFGMVALKDETRINQLPNITHDDVKNHYNNTHSSDNMRFIVAGDLDSNRPEIIQKFESVGLSRGSRIDRPDEALLNLNQLHYIERADLKNIYFLWQLFVPRELDAPDRDALATVNNMLTATLHSRILGEARERGLIYGISSGLSRAKNKTSWMFGGEVSPANAKPVFEIIVRELSRIAEGVIDEKDIEATKNYMLGRHQRSVQTVGGVIGSYAGSYFYDDTVEDPSNIPARIDAVTKQRMVKIVKEFLACNMGGFSTMGNGDELLSKELLASLRTLVDPVV